MKSAIKAGIYYFLLVFAAAFVLGVIRTRLIVPNFGETAGVVIELPVILLWSWIVCGWIIRRVRLAPETSRRLVMGVLALVLTIAAETSVAVIGLKITPLEHFHAYATPARLIGLAAQLLFAAMPWLRMKYVLPRRYT